jgi:hypothetical protein
MFALISQCDSLYFGGHGNRHATLPHMQPDYYFPELEVLFASLPLWLTIPNELLFLACEPVLLCSS